MRPLPIFVVMPALDEEDSLPLVLASLAALAPDVATIREIIVVDNGSRDRTAAIALDCGATLLREEERGYGAACLRAIDHIAKAPEIVHGGDAIIVFIDADYSDYPEDMEKLVQPIAQGHCDFVLGSRLIYPEAAKAVPLPSRFGNGVATIILNLLFGQRFSDLGPFRAIRYSALTGLAMRDRNWGWTIEMQVRACRRGLRILEVPVRYRSRHAGESKISGSLLGGIKAGAKILWILAFAIADSLRDAQEATEEGQVRSKG
jgi:glycosyltransferase involved in cell wall biosynthesis